MSERSIWPYYEACCLVSGTFGRCIVPSRKVVIVYKYCAKLQQALLTLDQLLLQLVKSSKKVM